MTRLPAAAVPETRGLVTLVTSSAGSPESSAVSRSGRLAARFDLTRIAAELVVAETAGRPIAQTSDYHGQYHFTGRLKRPIATLTKDSALAWAKENPEGLVIDYRRDEPATYPTQPPFAYGYRGRYVVIWPSAAIILHGRTLLGD